MGFDIVRYTAKTPQKNFWSNFNQVYYNDSEAYKVVYSQYSRAERVCLTPVEKADLFRYAIVYLEGGIYADSDTVLESDPHTWPKVDFLIGVEFLKPLQFNQWTFAASRFSPILQHVVYYINDHMECRQETLKKTGPIIWTKAILDFLDLHNVKNISSRLNQDIPISVSYNHNGQEYKGFIMPYRSFSYPGYQENLRTSPNLVRHLFAGSWKEPIY